jgi:DNA helicase-2/ATP-dependent DNA helicase PcrA
MTKKREIVLSKYNVAINEAYKKTTGHIAISAGPGTGKSFQLLELLRLTPRWYKTILCAFNGSIVDELKEKVPRHVEVSTIHSLAFKVLRDNTNKRYKVQAIKNWVLGKQHLKLNHIKSEKDKNIYLFEVSKLIDLYRLNMCTTREEIETIAISYGVDSSGQMINDTAHMIEILKKYNSDNSKEFMIDFVDMLYLAVTQVKAYEFPKYNVVMVDESQDLSPLQKEFIHRIIKKRTGRGVFVGDERQAIYGFIGANTQCFRDLMSAPNTTVLPLSISYRCPKKVVAMANKIFPGLEASPDAIEGEVRKGSLSELQDGDHLLCRNNLPIVETFIELLRQKKKSYILGKDFGKSLLSLIRKLKSYKTFGEGKITILEEKEEQLKKKGVSHPTKNTAYVGLEEKLVIVSILVDEFESYGDVEIMIEKLFTDNEKQGIKMSTIHKAKGLEAKRIFILGWSLMPSKHAKTEMELEQEKCLQYVCLTRTKESLIFVTLNKKQKEREEKSKSMEYKGSSDTLDDTINTHAKMIDHHFNKNDDDLI